MGKNGYELVPGSPTTVICNNGDQANLSKPGRCWTMAYARPSGSTGGPTAQGNWAALSDRGNPASACCPDDVLPDEASDGGLGKTNVRLLCTGRSAATGAD